jgi:stage III sporulation protein SpoIIIAA
MTRQRITDDLHALLGVLPKHIADAVVKENNSDKLLEIVLDLGRIPLARFVDCEVKLSESEVSHEDIDFVVSRIGEFDADNRAGLERTLHRISAIRNRRGHIVGLTCRVGRAVYGTIGHHSGPGRIGQVQSADLGQARASAKRPCCARRRACAGRDQHGVVIVDTSNEIGGDGDVPHPAVGRARRMQVAHALAAA